MIQNMIKNMEEMDEKIERVKQLLQNKNKTLVSEFNEAYIEMINTTLKNIPSYRGIYLDGIIKKFRNEMSLLYLAINEGLRGQNLDDATRLIEDQLRLEERASEGTKTKYQVKEITEGFREELRNL